MGDFHGTGIEIWAGFGLELGPLAVPKKKVWANYEQLLRISKGQIISECPYEIIVSPKIATRNFRDFCPGL